MFKFNPLTETSRLSQVLEVSKIREIAEIGLALDDVIPLWFGESFWPTSTLVVDAAIASLQAQNFKYLPNNGAMNFREEICRYSNVRLDCVLTTERITVTQSGMQGLALAAQLLVNPGDRVVTIEPGWPNIAGAFLSAGAIIEKIQLSPLDCQWSLDIDVLLSLLTPNTKAIIINSPNNPTGWTMTACDQKVVLAHCRKHGIWIVADDVYSRLYRHGNVAPSFLTISEPEDLLLSINSFSKCWSMTGWRLGWIVAPTALEAKLGQLTEFNTCCTPGFIQDAGLVAMRDGENEVAKLVTWIDAGYSLIENRLSEFDRVGLVRPDGAFYCFFKVDGLTDSFEAVKRIMKETGVGLAPGIAFGECGEGYFRLCHGQPKDVLEKACDRLSPFFK